MGRELKRVPLDFKWPIDQLWKGYVNTYRSQPCKSCDKTGLNPETKKLHDEWYAFDNPDYIDINANRRYNNRAWQYHLTEVEVEALVRAGRLSDVIGISCYFDAQSNKWMGWVDNKKTEIECPLFPTPEDVNQWAIHSMGHDAINRHICVEARAQSLGVYGHCEYCEGEGEIWASEKIKQLSEEWKEFHPPVGEGYQLWTTTSEGSPMTPVFPTLEALCEYCEANKVSVFGNNTATAEKWKEMLTDDNVHHQEGNIIFF